MNVHPTRTGGTIKILYMQVEYSIHCIQEFLKDMKDLHCLLPTHQPRVSEHLEKIKTMISKIIDNGYAYQVDGDVYFSVEKFSDYGRLSGQNIENHQVGMRVKADSNSRKQNISDFTLWKAAKPGEPSWDSPWGLRRPGRHIECSAMSSHHLTSSFDIHGGGLDLIFPHHENEIAQSCAACADANVKYWVHSGRFNIDGQKMSKSLGNFDSVRDDQESIMEIGHDEYVDWRGRKLEAANKGGIMPALVICGTQFCNSEQEKLMGDKCDNSKFK